MSLENIKKGDTVVIKGFTGIRLTEAVITAADKKTLTLEKKDGSEMVFSRKSGIQTNVEEGKEKYANKIVTLAESPAPKTAGKKDPGKAPAKSKDKVKVVEPEEDDEDEDEEEEDDEPVETPKQKKARLAAEEAAKAKKAADKKKASAGTKKSKAVVEEDDEDEDEDEYEEV